MTTGTPYETMSRRKSKDYMHGVYQGLVEAQVDWQRRNAVVAAMRRHYKMAKRKADGVKVGWWG